MDHSDPLLRQLHLVRTLERHAEKVLPALGVPHEPFFLEEPNEYQIPFSDYTFSETRLVLKFCGKTLAALPEEYRLQHLEYVLCRAKDDLEGISKRDMFAPPDQFLMFLAGEVHHAYCEYFAVQRYLQHSGAARVRAFGVHEFEAVTQGIEKDFAAAGQTDMASMFQPILALSLIRQYLPCLVVPPLPDSANPGLTPLAELYEEAFTFIRDRPVEWLGKAKLIFLVGAYLVGKVDLGRTVQERKMALKDREEAVETLPQYEDALCSIPPPIMRPAEELEALVNQRLFG